MPMHFACPKCGRTLRMGEELLGTLVRCPSCSHEFVADESLRQEISESPAATPPPPPPGDDDRIREGEPPPQSAGPPRAAGLPRFDDYEEDDDDERARVRRRFRREDDLNRIIERVRRPASNLIILGWICIVLSGLTSAVQVFVVVGAGAGAGPAFGPGPGAGPPRALFVSNSAISVVRTIAHLAISILILVGGQNMKRLN